MKANISDDGGYLRSAAAVQRRHLRALARHVNRADAAQRASADHIGQMRRLAKQARDKRQKFSQQLEDVLAGGGAANSPTAVNLSATIADLDQQIADGNAELIEADERCSELVAVCAPLRDQLLAWMHSLRIDASSIGLGDSGASNEVLHVVDLSQIATRSSAEGGAK